MKKGQATIEFALAFVVTILLVVLTANVFVWVNHCIVRRQVAYENTRSIAGDGREPSWWEFWKKPADPGKDDFYTPPKLNIFKLGGR